jgi:hypothetical protein
MSEEAGLGRLCNPAPAGTRRNLCLTIFSGLSIICLIFWNVITVTGPGTVSQQPVGFNHIL